MMPPRDMVKVTVSSESDALQVARYSAAVADALGLESLNRLRLIAAALHLAMTGADVEFRIEGDGAPVLAVRAQSDNATASVHTFELPPGATPASLPDIEEGSRNSKTFSATLLHDAEQAQAAQGLIHSLQSELEETNRGVLALYAELDDRAEKLRRADDLKSRFLSYASHELRTPLNGIIGLVRLLQSSSVKREGEEGKQLSFIRKAAEEMREMVNDLLDLAKVEAGKVTIQPSEFGLDFVFGALRGIFRPLLATDDVVLIFDDTTAVPSIYSDEAKVSQILRNFISNALKFTEHGDVRVWAELENDRVRISVRDTGIGIAPEHLGRIFEEYSQIDSPLQRRTRGTGLGLPLCKKLAELLGGSVEVESELGRGSVFSVVLPRRYDAAEPGAKTAVTHVPDQTQSLRVLLIEDSEIDRYLVKQLLKAGGDYKVLEAHDGQVGLDMAMREIPDVIILDLNLPRIDGLRVLAEVRNSPLTADIPVIIVSARNLSEDEMLELRARTTAFFAKDALSEIGALELRAGPPLWVKVIER